MRRYRFLLLAAVATSALVVPVERAVLVPLRGAPTPLYAQALADDGGSGRGGRAAGGPGPRQRDPANGGDGGGGDQGNVQAGPRTGPDSGQARARQATTAGEDNGGGPGQGNVQAGPRTGRDEGGGTSDPVETRPAPGVGVGSIGDDRHGTEPDDLLALDLQAGDVRRARAEGFGVRERRALPNLGLVVTRLTPPRGLPVAAATARLRAALPERVVGADAVYTPQGDGCDPGRCWGMRLVGWRPFATGCGGAVVGLVDTRVDATHRALAGRKLTTRSFVPAGSTPAPAEHGTALAVLLGGSPDEAPESLLPSASLVVADVFADDGAGRARADALAVAAALDWLVGQKPTVINAALAGPDSPVLAAAVAAVLARGVPVVAAAGNGGPAAPPAYPAAYPGVLAATAVDRDLRPYRKANRGDYVTFAAPGVDLPTATAGGGTAPRSGTSYATAFVTAAVAEEAVHEPGVAPRAIERRLARTAVDLGAPGRDPVFGWGLIHAPAACGARG